MATSTRSGDVLAGRYRLIDLLSESGGGRFWRAHDNVLERFVALHVIAEDDARAAGLVEAARVSARVLDARILRVLDAEEEDGRCFVVNEWGTGISLDILVTHAGPLDPRRAAWLVADVAGALAKAHAAGVTHGRLNPENVLIDRYGSVRIIGMCVDAALHGLSPGDVRSDLEDLGGLLYCALTGTWPGPSGSIVPAAPRESGVFLSPRQVVAGVPKPLDLLWREFDCRSIHGRRLLGAEHPDVTSADAIATELLAFVGDPTGMPEALARAVPAINELRPVWLPALADPLPHDSSRDDLPVVPDDSVLDGPEEQPDRPVRPEPGPDLADVDDGPPIPLVTELPTEAGMPVFDDDDVSWLRTRSTPPPPPPPFEEPPERPLFAPDPPGGPRRPRIAAVPAEAPVPPGATDYWPWETGGGGGAGGGNDDDTTEDERVPGRTWLRLAMAVGLAVLLLVAVAIAFNLGRGRTPLGHDPDDDRTPEPSVSRTTTPGAVLKDVTARDFDPLDTSTGRENPDTVGNVVDGDPATAWRTSRYDDQLGPELPALKSGVGLLLDLGRVRTVTSVDVRELAGKATVSLYAATEAPTEAPTGEPVATTTGSGRLVLTPAARSVPARYLVLWWTVLPPVDGGFRAEIAEVVVRGE